MEDAQSSRATVTSRTENAVSMLEMCAGGIVSGEDLVVGGRIRDVKDISVRVAAVGTTAERSRASK